MKYRDAKKLHNGDEVIRKSDKAILTVKDVEVYGQNRVVRLNCVTAANAAVSLFHDEVE
jgi:hypothetical protein